MEHVIGRLLQDYERGKMTRRQLIQALALTATAAVTVGPAEAASPANAISINHVSMQVTDYAKTRDLLGSGDLGAMLLNQIDIGILVGNGHGLAQLQTSRIHPGSRIVGSPLSTGAA